MKKEVRPFELRKALRNAISTSLDDLLTEPGFPIPENEVMALLSQWDEVKDFLVTRIMANLARHAAHGIMNITENTILSALADLCWQLKTIDREPIKM